MAEILRGYFPVDDLRTDCVQAINGCEWLLRTEPWCLAASEVSYILIDPTGDRVDNFFTGAHRWETMSISTALEIGTITDDMIIASDDRIVFVDVCPQAACIVRRALQSNPVQPHFAKWVVKAPLAIA